ncbi:MAG: beta-galactosidase [Endomicrobiales bacterium]|nr:beta-galactosidase [Endomicrobiales bacterium]
MENKKIISYDSKSVFIRGKRVILIGGEIHYYRIPNELWEDRLKKMKRSGANFVSTYIPWNWHEQEEGVYKWDGDQDLPKFLDLCKKYDLYVALKPGPYICAEWDCGGFPDWILKKNLKMRLNDDRYFQHVDKWYNEVARVILPHLITRNGSVVLFQIENEYDHLMLQQRDIIISNEEAMEHLGHLLKITKSAGIDVPIFTIEGVFVHGTEIIDTRTFYPNIPWLWMWEFDDFDKKFKQSKKTQPDKPIFVPELQGGWFAQFGQPEYNPPSALTAAIIRNVLSHGASLIGVFMFTGGTTFPYWGCRGDARGDGNMKAIGSVTSYDFGSSPIREWGELNDKYYDIKSIAMLLNAFPHLFTDTEVQEGAAKIIAGDDDTHIIRKDSVVTGTFPDHYEKVTVVQKSNKDTGFLMVRNVETYKKELLIRYKVPGSNSERTLPSHGKLLMPSHSAFLFPIEVKIPNTDYVIQHSTSEILTSKKIGKEEVVLFYGPNKGKEELIIRGVNRKPQYVSGNIKYKYDSKEKSLTFSYFHHGIQMIKLDKTTLVILDNEHARKTWVGAKGNILISDSYYFSGNSAVKKGVELSFHVKNGSTNNNLVFLEKKPSKISVDGKKIPFKWNKNFGFASFIVHDKKERALQIKKDDCWHAKADSYEKDIDYNDSDWRVLKEPVYLEDVDLTKHGYYWYRAEFDKPSDVKDSMIIIDTGGIDRAYMYLNGEFLWKGIGKGKIETFDRLNKGKNTIAIRYENAYHTKGHPAEGPLIKKSGLAKPIEIHGTLNGKEWKYNINSLKVRYNLGGGTEGYYKKEFDDSKWLKIPQGEKYICHKELGDVIWFRYKFSYKKEKGYEAPLGLYISEALERLIIYLNGKLLGKYESCGPQHKFYIPESMLQEDNVLAIVLEGPGYNQFNPWEFKPPYIREPKFETFHESKGIKVEIS